MNIVIGQWLQCFQKHTFVVFVERNGCAVLCFSANDLHTSLFKAAVLKDPVSVVVQLTRVPAALTRLSG